MSGTKSQIWEINIHTTRLLELEHILTLVLIIFLYQVRLDAEWAQMNIITTD